MKKANIDKYHFNWSPRKMDESTKTVPDLVLSVAEIYRKYALTGDITQLPGKVRPFTYDDGDEFEDTIDPEEMTDSLLIAKELRESARTRQPSPANPAAKDKSVGAAVKQQDGSPAPKPQDTQVPSDADE